MTSKTVIFKEVFAKEIYLCLREYSVENNYFQGSFEEKKFTFFVGI